MSRPRLLLVEDSEEVTFVVRLCARRLGHDLVCFGEAETAWDYLQGLQVAESDHDASREARAAIPDLLLLDVNLPGENGLELCLRLRSAPGVERVPVALLGSWDRPGEIAEGLRVGIDFVLAKDLLARPEEWGVRLAEILTSTDSRRAALSVSCTAPPGQTLPPERWAEAFRHALGHPVVRALPSEVVPDFFRKAVRLAAQGTPDRRPDAWRDVLTAEGTGLNPAWPAREGPVAAVALATALADQLWCLRSAGAGLAFRDAFVATLSPEVPPPV